MINKINFKVLSNIKCNKYNNLIFIGNRSVTSRLISIHRINNNKFNLKKVVGEKLKTDGIKENCGCRFRSVQLRDQKDLCLTTIQ